MAFASACPRSGGAKYSAAVARRGESASRFSYRASTQAPEQNFSFPRALRLTRGAELQRTIREGKRLRTSSLDVRATASPLAHPRVGFVVPKFNHTAVQRNQLKRRLRELTRLRLLRAIPPMDLVIRTRRETYDVAFSELAKEIDDVRNRVSRLFVR